MFSGDERDRTANLLVANQALSQLSYVPGVSGKTLSRHGLSPERTGYNSEGRWVWLGRPRGRSALLHPFLDGEKSLGAAEEREGLPGGRGTHGVADFLDPLLDHLGRLADHRGPLEQAGGQ